MLPVLRDTYGNPSSFYARGRTARHLLNDARATLARCINADPAEIFFTSCGTESDNWVIKGAAAQLPRGKSRHIVTSRIEHHAVLHPVETLAKQGWAVSWLDSTHAGWWIRIRFGRLFGRTRRFSVMMANKRSAVQ